jgi:hypothetical protein
MKLKWMLASLLALLVIGVRPAPAYACDAWLCLGDMFGWTDVAKVHSDRDVKKAELDKQKADIDRQRAAEVARINADAQARLAEANRQIQADLNNSKITIAQAQAQADAFKTLVEQKAAESIAAINQNAQTAIAGINNAGQINLAGVQETGETARASIAAESHNNTVMLLVVGGLLAIVLVFVGFLMLRRQPAQVPQTPQVTFVLPEHLLSGGYHAQLPGQHTALPKNEYRMIEVDHE